MAFPDAVPGSAPDLLAAGRASLAEGQWERAREFFEQACELEESAEAWEGLANVAMWRSEVETAEATTEPSASTKSAATVAVRRGWPRSSPSRQPTSGAKVP